MSKDIINLGLSNFTGSLYAIKRDGKYFLILGNYLDDKEREISEEFYLSIVNEFVKK
ncbi:gp620 [Bacillus phage G]|uniref:Gp620 n=1 Tax=Bacillus phage G TaxID=2884420 RepID=G3MB00_9CAUD|nr:gp620 [Bacillus phage G]AEO93865.1 gp620 [Bacillus phage G]